MKKWLNVINKQDLEAQGTYNEGDEEIETEDDFDIDDVYTNDSISNGIWENYTKYLELLGDYLKKGSELKLTGDLKGVLLRKAFRAALKLTNAQSAKKKFKL